MDHTSGPPRHELRLQRSLLVTAVGMATLTLAACISLGVGAHIMGVRAERLGAAADQAQLTETLRADLLDLARTSNLVLSTHSADREKQRTEIQAKVYHDIVNLRLTSLPTHQSAIDKVASDVRSLEIARLRAEARSPDERGVAAVETAPLEAALASLAELRHAEADRVPKEQAGIAAWTRTSDLISWTAAILIALLSTALAAAAYKILIPPLLDLSAAMRRFAEGDRAARAQAGSSPAHEIASAARHFNDVAVLISSQHARMLAFLDAVSQGLQKPLRAMRGSLAELGPGKSLRPEENTRQTVATMSQELEHLDQLVLGFLDASRIEWQRLDLQLTRRDVRKLLTRVGGLYETFSPAHTVSLTVPEQPVSLRFDEGRMSQVLNTLLANAIHYSPRGGAVGVVLTTEPEGGGGEEKTRAVISVTDHGVGIPPEQIGTIFEPFHNVHAERQPRPGMVALSVAKRIVEAHGGSLDAESQPGVGTTFHVRLPLPVEAKGEAHGTSEPKAERAAAAEEERARPSSLPHPEPSH
jgi:signal transduction histidine kinase